jgi:hypothetical protein
VITFFYASIRQGKSSAATAEAIPKLNGDSAFEAIQNSILKSEDYATAKTIASMPDITDNLVYANIDIEGGVKDYPPGFSHRINPAYVDHDGKVDTSACEEDGKTYSFGMPNAPFKTYYFPPFSHIIVDEAHEIFPASPKTIHKSTKKWLSFVGQNEYELVLMSQRLMDIHVDVRGRCNRFIRIDGMRNYGKFGIPLPKNVKYYGDEIKFSKWHGRVFSKNSDAEAVDKDGSLSNKLGEPWSLTFKGNIFTHYDSFCFEGLIHEGNEDRPFFGGETC